MERCRIVLVRTQHPGNIGAIARVMRNFGASELVLASPQADHLCSEALARATIHGEPVLRAARVVETLAEAFSGCVLAAGTSARVEGLYRGQAVAQLPEAGAMVTEAAASGPVALAFGPERTGLENDEALQCHLLIRIPASEEYPVLNLAQAVAVCLYEVRRSWLTHSPAPPRDIAPFEDQERMLELLHAALGRSDYLRGPGGKALWHAIRHLLTRTQPSSTEVRLLMGLARQIDWLSSRAGL
jgi:tRNA/rRNA methyltransferase